MPSSSKSSRLRSADRAAHRVAAEGDAVQEARRAVEERLGEVVATDHRAERRVAAREALGARDHVGEVVVALRAEHRRRADRTRRSPRRTRAARRTGRRSRGPAGSSPPGERSSRRRSAPARGTPRRRSRALPRGSRPRCLGQPVAERGVVLAERVPVPVGVRDVASAPGVSGSNGVRSDGTPVIASAPSVVPWYAVSRAITL